MSTLAPGAALPEIAYEVTREDLVAYANASGDHNPIHQDDAFALAIGLPGVIAHGMYTMALMGRAVAEWTGSAEVVDIGAKFTAPVVVPAEGAATVTFAGTVGERTDDGLLPISMVVTAGDAKVLGVPRATVRG